jgi:hypothetical protein
MSDVEYRKGKKAEQLHDDEVFSSALEKLQNDQIWIWKSTRPEDTLKREQAWMMVQAIESFRTEIKKLIDNGKVAQRAIERAQKNLI